MTVVESVDGGFSTLSLIAGSLRGGGHVDGVGAAARFEEPTSVTADGVGNVYVSDAGNCTIRKVVVSTGQVTTLAGAPSSCSPVDGTGTQAGFAAPGALAVDGVGNLYVADSDIIRRVVLATGEVSTLAGSAETSCAAVDGTGAAAGFCGLSGLAADGGGNLYAADANRNTIRKVVVATGEVTTLAGSGSPAIADGADAAASFDGPGALALDATGVLFVADNNFTIREVAVANAVVSTLVNSSTDFRLGRGAARFDAPSGIALDGADNLYVAAGGTVVKVVIATGEASEFAGLGSPLSGSGDPGGFGDPAETMFRAPRFGLATDGSGNLYVADETNDAIRQVAIATEEVTTLAGSEESFGGVDGTGEVARFNQPNAVVADLAGNLYVADTDNDTIRQVVVATGETETLAGFVGLIGAADGRAREALFDHPSGLAIDRAGNLYVADTGNNTIRKMVISSAVVSTIAGSASLSGSADGIGAEARFSGPRGLALDDSGNLFVADRSNVTIRRIVLATGAVTTLAGTAGVFGTANGRGPGAEFQSPNGLAVDAAGGLYVVDSGTIRKISVETGVVTTLETGSNELGGPTGLALDGSGYPLVTDTQDNMILRLDVATNSVMTLVGAPGSGGADVLGALPAGLYSPTGLVIGPGGDLFVTSPTAVLVVR